MAFTLSHFISQIRPRDLFRLLAIGMCHFLPVHHFGMGVCSGRRSIYNIAIHPSVYPPQSVHIHLSIYLSLFKSMCVYIFVFLPCEHLTLYLLSSVLSHKRFCLLFLYHSSLFFFSVSCTSMYIRVYIYLFSVRRSVSRTLAVGIFSVSLFCFRHFSAVSSVLTEYCLPLPTYINLCSSTQYISICLLISTYISQTAHLSCFNRSISVCYSLFLLLNNLPLIYSNQLSNRSTYRSVSK